MTCLRTTLAALALVLTGAARAGEAPKTSVPGGDFEGAEPWKGWVLEPAEPLETGRSEWETRVLEFPSPASGRVAVELFMRGAGCLEFDALELYRLKRRRAPISERRLLANPSFEAPAEGRPATPVGWKLSGGARRAPGSAFAGKACLRLALEAPGRSAALQGLAVRKGQRYRLVVRARGRLTAGSGGAAVRPAGAGRAVLAFEELVGPTLAGGRGRCGRLSAKRGAQRAARLELDAKAGANYTLRMLARGGLGERGRLKVEVRALGKDGNEQPVAGRELAPGQLGPDWRPLRLNFALRGARRLRLTLSLEGPGILELDNLRLSAPEVVPAPRRLAPGDAGDNFRPRGRRPLITSGGRADAGLVRVFTALVGERMERPTSFWQFWRSGRAFDHRGQPFEKLLKRGLPDCPVILLDASRQKEAKWLADQAITVPDRPGAYAVSVSSKGLFVAARSREGFLAAASALSWLSADGPEPEMFSCRIEDWPAHPLRAAAIDFDGRLAQSDRASIAALGAYRLSHLVVTGDGFWRLAEPRTRADARDLAELASSAGLGLMPFLDALGAAPALAERCPQCVEGRWQRAESHYLRGTERSYLAAPGVVRSKGAGVEVTAPGGASYQAGRDYVWGSGTPIPRQRSWLRRIPGGKIPDGGQVLLSYNALPPAGEKIAACPRSAEALEMFGKQLQELARVGEVARVGLGGRLGGAMRTDKRTRSTRFKNGRLVADRVRELAAILAKRAPKASPFLWGDLLNPCGALELPEDSPAAAAELLERGLRGKLVVLVRLGRSDAAGAGCITASARFLVGRGYRTAGWCGASGQAARLWARALAAAKEEEAKAARASKKEKPGLGEGLVLDLRGARGLDIEAFAEAAWRGPQR